MNRLIIYFVIILVTMGCTETPVILPEKVEPASGKVVLLEDLTGVDCSNCPQAALRLEEIADEFPGSILVVGIHGTQQTKPIEGSKYDFRNEDAVFLEEYLRPWLGKPAVAFNRRRFSDQQGSNGNLSLIGVTQIATRTEEILQEQQTVNIESTYDWVNEEERTIEIFAGIKALEDLEGDFNVNVLITESHIIDAQNNALTGGIDLDYEHNHVLRDVISNTTGEQLDTILVKDELINKSWTYTIPQTPDGLWVIENLEVIIFVSNLDGESKEILQANKLKLQ